MQRVKEMEDMYISCLSLCSLQPSIPLAWWHVTCMPMSSYSSPVLSSRPSSRLSSDTESSSAELEDEDESTLWERILDSRHMVGICALSFAYMLIIF